MPVGVAAAAAEVAVAAVVVADSAAVDRVA